MNISPDCLPFAVAAMALLVGAFMFLKHARSGAGCRSADRSSYAVGSRLLLLEQGPKRFEEAGSVRKSQDVIGEDAVAMTPSSSMVGQSFGPPKGGIASSVSLPPSLRFHLGKASMPPPACYGCAEIWDVRSTEDASALLAGCPLDSIICCGFSMPHADGLTVQVRTLRELAAAQPAGFVFASVDVHDSPDVAKWAGVSEVMVRLMRSDGTVVDEVRPAEVRQGALQSKVFQLASSVVEEATPKLEALAMRFPGALQGEMLAVAPKSGAKTMQQHVVSSAQRLAMSGADEEALRALCQCCLSAKVPRVRHVASLARILRNIPSSEHVPFLDLARRLAAQSVLDGVEPGSQEALEFLLDAVLCSGMDDESFDATRSSLALSFFTCCIAQERHREALLPVVGQIVRTKSWDTAWRAITTTRGTAETRLREATATLLLNASVAFRAARWRVEHAGLLGASVNALRCVPEDKRVNLAVGNLLAVGGSPEDAKRSLQAQPLAPLRVLAAAVFRGDLDGPDGAAFPLAWRPEPPSAGVTGQVFPDAWDRRPRHAPIPARHRTNSKGGG